MVYTHSWLSHFSNLWNFLIQDWLSNKRENEQGFSYSIFFRNKNKRIRVKICFFQPWKIYTPWFIDVYVIYIIGSWSVPLNASVIGYLPILKYKKKFHSFSFVHFLLFSLLFHFIFFLLYPQQRAFIAKKKPMMVN